jgi:hypothetical protein
LYRYIQVVVLFYLAWVTPYRVAFDAAAFGYEFWFEFVVDLYFIIDVFLNFITGYWKDMELTSVLVSDPLVGFITPGCQIGYMYPTAVIN